MATYRPLVLRREFGSGECLFVQGFTEDVEEVPVLAASTRLAVMSYVLSRKEFERFGRMIADQEWRIGNVDGCFVVLNIS